MPLLRRDGSCFGVLCALDPRPTPLSGELLDMFGLFSQLITHELEAEEAQRERGVALRSAEAANRAKDMFIATVSHELRTPLNAVLGWVQVLRTGNVPPELEERALEAIERNAAAQARLVEDLVDLSRISSGKVQLGLGPVDLADVVSASVDTVRPQADTAGVRLEAELPSTATTVTGDPTRLQQVCWNLLSNAVKFTPPGGEVRVTLARRGAGVELTVADTGCGIAPELLPHVFERFKQEEADSGAGREGGLGLGLAIVRHLVDLHKGSVRAASEGRGCGATFTVSLPAADPAG